MNKEEPENLAMNTYQGSITGFTMLHTFQGDRETASHIAWSPREYIIALASHDSKVRFWNLETEYNPRALVHTDPVYSVEWSPDGQLLASGSQNRIIRIWDTHTHKLLKILEGHSGVVKCLAWSQTLTLLASGSEDRTILLWDTQRWKAELRHSITHSGAVNSVAWSPNGQLLASGSDDTTIRLWKSYMQQNSLIGHSGAVNSVAWSPNGQLLASGSDDTTIRLWNPHKGEQIQVLEFHTSPVISISFSSDGQLLASESLDGTIYIWRTETWKIVKTLKEPVGDTQLAGLTFHPQAPILAVVSEKGRAISVWNVDTSALLKVAQDISSVHYTSVKIALVGDSGVGKTGLGYRIAEDRYLVTESTHGQQFWIVDKLSKTRQDGSQCEAVLWDFAGQPNFRAVHALFLDDIDLALLVFDPGRHDTLMSVDYWLKQLSHLQQSCRTVLVVGRIDVSGLSISPAELKAFCQERGIRGGFVMTSAKTREGIDILLETINQQIDWDAKPATVTTETFKHIKDYVLRLKADAERKNVLVDPKHLQVQLQARDSNWQFDYTQMMIAISHLQNHGYVTILRYSSDEQRILLAPDLLINLVARCMLKAQLNERGLGTLEESAVLSNTYRFPEIEHLSDDERDTLLTAVIELFLARNICFRESVDNRTFLIFPSLIFERPPRLKEVAKLKDDMTYFVTGLIENVYPALVVLLGYAPNFQRTYQWRKQAQYETIQGHICGFMLVNDDPAELELLLYYGQDTPDFERMRFQGLFEEILYSHQVTVKKYQPVLCPNTECRRQQERHIVIKRIQEGKKNLYCDDCGTEISLHEAQKTAKSNTFSFGSRTDFIRDQELGNMRTSYETALVYVKRLARTLNGSTIPTCFISYAWGNSIQERWVLRLVDDLRNAGIDALLDQLDNSAIGANVTRFASRIEQSDFVIVIGTPSYREKYENKVSRYGSMVAAEVDLINVRLTGTEAQKASVLPVLLEGEERLSFPPLLHRRVYGNFAREEYYFTTLFDLVLTLYGIPFDDPVVRDLRTELRDKAQIFIKTWG